MLEYLKNGVLKIMVLFCQRIPELSPKQLCFSEHLCYRQLGIAHNGPSQELFQIYSEPQAWCCDPTTGPPFPNRSGIAGSVSSHSSEMSCGEMTGLPHRKNTSGFLQVKRKNLHPSLSTCCSSPSHHMPDVEDAHQTASSIKHRDSITLQSMGEGDFSQAMKMPG